jgi:hypothetical protein
MSIEKMREEFEAWVLSNWPNQSLDRFNPLHGVTEGEYTGFTVQHCWDAWKASRAALVIDLSECQKTTALPNKTWLLNDDAQRLIEAAGVKVKL